MKGQIYWLRILGLALVGVSAFWVRRIAPGPDYMLDFPFLTLKQILWAIGFICIASAVYVAAFWIWYVYADEDYGKVSDAALLTIAARRINESPRWQTANRWTNRLFWGAVLILAVFGGALMLMRR